MLLQYNLFANCAESLLVLGRILTILFSSLAEKALEFITGRGLLQAPANTAVMPSNAANTAVGEMPLEEVRVIRVASLEAERAPSGPSRFTE